MTFLTKARDKILSRNSIILILVFLAYYFIWGAFFHACPLFYDMYVMKSDYLIRGSSFIGVLKAVFFTGGAWKNARYLVNIINIYIVSYEFVSDWIMPLVFLGGIWFSQRVVSENKKWYAALLGFGLFLGVSPGIVGQCYSYSYVLFLLPILFITLFSFVIQEYIKDNTVLAGHVRKALFLILVYLNACFNEHISCAFSLIMIFYCFREYVLRKRKDKLLLIATIISLIQTLYMNLYLIILKTRPLADDTAGLAKIIKGNFRILLIETWISNPIIFVTFLLILSFCVRKKISWFLCDLVITTGYIIWVVFIYSGGSAFLICPKIEADMPINYIPSNLWWLWGALFIGVNLFIFYQIVSLSEGIATVFFAGGCSTVPVILTPNTGWRISAFYVFCIILVTVMLIEKTELVKVAYAICIACAVVVAFIGTRSFFQRIERISVSREEIESVIKDTRYLQREGEWKIEEDVMYLPGYSDRDVVYGGRFGENSYYKRIFCYINGLDSNTILEDIIYDE